MKKLSIIVLIMALMLTMLLVGCGEDTAESTETTVYYAHGGTPSNDAAGVMVDSSTRVSFGFNAIETHHANTSHQPTIIFSGGDLGTVMPRVARGGGDNVTTAPGYRIIMVVDGVVYQVGEMSAVGT